MGENMYGNSHSSIFQYPPCAKQNQIIDQQYYPHSTMQINNYNNPNMYDIYNLPGQNLRTNCEAPNEMNWDSKILSDVEKTIKLPERMELIEITSKDLSPASFTSNIDLNDTFKNSKEYKFDNQYYYNYNSPRNIDYPSCAQLNRNNYYSKNNEFENDLYLKQRAECNDNFYNYFEKFPDSLMVPNEYFLSNPEINFPSITPINQDQQTECSNESDIIVEDSEDEVTDYCEETEKQFVGKCVVCNISYSVLGVQFYSLTKESPLSMSTQRPIFEKIVDIVGRIPSKSAYLCSECLGLVNTIDHLQWKLNNFHKELILKFKETCMNNNVSFNLKSELSKPLKQRRFYLKNISRYKCKVCKKVLCLKKYCLWHLRKHKFEGLLCHTCGKLCKTKKLFLTHMKLHKRRKFSLNCSNSSCGKRFAKRSNLREHENFCLGILPFACPKDNCDKKFPSTTKLKNHIKLKHDKKFVAICSICNIGFVKLSDYKSHMITHSTDKKFSCGKCDKSYKTLSNLNFHMKVHEKSLPFVCNICEKGFMRKEYLEAHVNNHNGVKNYKCTICEKKFVSQKNLDTHFKYHEGTVKTSTCNICCKTFSSGFEEHLRVHNNLREFECDKCDLRFNTKGSLYKHKKKKHNK